MFARSSVVDPELRRLAFSSPVHFLSLGFGSGLSPWAPGTMGTLVAVPLYLLLEQLAPLVYVSIVAALFGLGVWLCGKTTRALGVEDHGAIVWDEIVGLLVTMIAAPPQWWWILLGVMLFRLFDIAKPFPVGYIDRHAEGGLGIMLDDLAAGLYAWVVLQVLALAL